ncbi:hypothetical protein ACFXPA_29150 [Amycolatopsis sp. NPDC059090]|uniref:hypothetical protein n=1 Tax=Amycolatopsis sp. NPDC059090 TaxID=3346723 RepID=UPI003670401A
MPEFVVPTSTGIGFEIRLDTDRLACHLSRSRPESPVCYATLLPYGPSPLSFRSNCMAPRRQRGGFRSISTTMRVVPVAGLAGALPAGWRRSPAVALEWPGKIDHRAWPEFWSSVLPGLASSVRRGADFVLGWDDVDETAAAALHLIVRRS